LCRVDSLLIVLNCLTHFKFSERLETDDFVLFRTIVISYFQTSQGKTGEFPELACNQDSIKSTTSVRDVDKSNLLRYSLRKESVRKPTSKRAELVARRQRLLRRLTVLSNPEITNATQQISPRKISVKTTETDTAGSCDSYEITGSEKSMSTVMSSCSDNISLGSTNNTQLTKTEHVALKPLHQKKIFLKLCRCPICDAELPSRKLIKQHINEQHFSSIEAEIRNAEPLELTTAELNMSCTDDSTNQACFDCPDCGLTVRTAGSLKRHRTDIHGKDKRQYTCEICGISVSSASSLSRHKVLVHNPQRKHVCGDCGRAFAMRQTLNQHVSGVHLKNRPHLCSLCGDRFLKKDNLRNHMRLVHRDN